MPTVHFTSHLSSYADREPVAVEGETVWEVLDASLANNQRLRSYLFDEQGRLRRHVAVFVEGQAVTDRSGLTDPVPPHAEVHVMQALSGG